MKKTTQRHDGRGAGPGRIYKLVYILAYRSRASCYTRKRAGEVCLVSKGENRPMNGYRPKHFDRETEELLTVMAGYDLHPKTILWDGCTHEFPGAGQDEGRDGWYIAYPGREGAVFNDRSTEVTEHWAPAGDVRFTDKERRKWKGQAGLLEREQAASRKEAQEQLELTWGSARAPRRTDPQNHAYLWNKRIPHPCPKIRISKRSVLDEDTGRCFPAGVLLVPMYVDGERVNLQCIWPDGRSEFWPGALVAGAMHPIGLAKGEARHRKKVYVCIGWESAWAIHEATESVTVAAFAAENLKAVAEHIRWKWNPERIIVAADHDPSKTVLRSGDASRPYDFGLMHAHAAAAAVDGQVAMPADAFRERRTTTLSDIRLEEGLDSVRACLIETVPPSTKIAAGERLDDPEEKNQPWAAGSSSPKWTDAAPFQCVGHNQGTYYFRVLRTGKVHEFTSSKLGKRISFRWLAPLEWWIEHFKGKTRGEDKFDIEQAATALVQQCHGAGVFHGWEKRGPGCWLSEGGGFVMHLGNRLLAPGAERYTHPERYRDGDRFYQERRPLPGPDHESPMSVEEARAVLEPLNLCPWEDPASAELLMGWLVTAPFGGALSTRPIVCVSGYSHQGILGGMVGLLRDTGMLRSYGDCSATDLRNQLAGGSVPVVLDAAPMTGNWGKTEALFDLAQASMAERTRGDHPFRGVPNPEVRSMFLFGANVVKLEHDRDLRRTVVLQLRNQLNWDAEDRTRWIQYLRVVWDDDKPLSYAGRRLMARTVEWFRDGRMDSLLRVTISAAEKVLQRPRMARIYGTLAAGAWTVRSDTVPKEKEIIAWFKSYARGICRAPDVVYECLSILLRAKRRLHVSYVERDVMVGDLIDVVTGQSQLEATEEEADEVLRSSGLMVQDDRLLIANQSKWVDELFRDTPFQERWRQVLRKSPAATARPNPVRFCPRLQSRVIALPIWSLAAPAPGGL